MDFKDVSSWLVSSSLSTKGTRDKLILTRPESSEDYFLKFPMIRPNRDYRSETWSEIIAYEVGTYLGFNVLKYEPAAYNGRIGCLSKNMIEPERNEYLIEGHSILSSYDNTYNPESKESYKNYTFDFMCKALRSFGAENCIPYFIKMLIFDAIIGNSDRHQSNWGIIQSCEPDGSSYCIDKEAAPIYDSGCCLGREFNEIQIINYLEDKNRFEKYIRNGRAELRIDTDAEKKPQHTELISYIMSVENNKWESLVVNEMRRVLQMYDKNIVTQIVADIDSNVPYLYKDWTISIKRKEFIVRVIDERINKLNIICDAATCK